MEKEYHLGRNRLALISLFLMFALITAGRGFYLYITLNDPMWILPGIVPLVIAAVVFPLLLTTKLTITTWSITRVGLLGTKEMLISDIIGYKLRHIPRTRRMVLVLVARDGRTLDVRYFQLADGDEILHWAQERFARLDRCS